MRSVVKEREHIKRLEKNNIILEEVYEKVKDKQKKEYIRRSDSDLEENIINCYLKEKRYYLDGKLLATDDQFDQETKYTYISFKNQNLKFECPNCGFNDYISKFYNGCPYCNSTFYIDYEKTQMPVSARNGYDDLKFLSKKGRKILLVISIIICLAVNIFLLVTKSMNIGDVFSMILGDLLLFIPILLVIHFNSQKEYLSEKDKYLSNKEQDLDYIKSKKKFYNDVYDLIFDDMYKNPDNVDIVDFNIIDYYDLSYNQNGYLYDDSSKDVKVKVCAHIKKIYFKENDFVRDSSSYWITVRKNKDYESDLFKFQKMQCEKCGSPLISESDECPSCGQKYSIPREWGLEYISKVE